MIEQANAVASTAGGAAALTGVSRPVLLREAREAAGLHIAALAAALKVPVKKLEALEAGRYDELPDMTFARALAASACRHLKVDAASVLEQIPLGAQPKLGDSPQAINAPYKTSQDAAPTTAASWLTRPAVLGALALLLGALVIVFLPELPGIDSAPEPAPTAAPPTEAPSTEAPQVPPVVVDPAATEVAPMPVSPVSAPAAAAPLAGSSVAVPAPASAASASTPAPITGGSLLSITASGESWVEVVNGSGSVVVQRMLKAGDVLDFSSAPPYAVVIGRADAAQVLVRGKPMDITPYARNSVARFEVK